MDLTPELFLDEIFEIEADGMLDDIMFSSFMMPFLMDFDKNKKISARKYIISVLKQCYQDGNLRVAIQHEGETLYGFALLFVYPMDNTTYLHKIFIHEQYRNNGLGTNILNNLKSSDTIINLICSDRNIEFYEKNGFRYVQPFEMPEDDNFKLSKGLYAGLSVMTTSKDDIDANVFLLNDNDLKIIAGLN